MGAWVGVPWGGDRISWVGVESFWVLLSDVLYDEFLLL